MNFARNTQTMFFKDFNQMKLHFVSVKYWSLGRAAVRYSQFGNWVRAGKT